MFASLIVESFVQRDEREKKKWERERQQRGGQLSALKKRGKNKIPCTDPSASSVYFPGACHGRCEEFWELTLHSPTKNRNVSVGPSPSLCLPKPPRGKGWGGTKAGAEHKAQTQRLWGLFGLVTTKSIKILPKTQQQQKEQREREKP